MGKHRRQWPTIEPALGKRSVLTVMSIGHSSHSAGVTGSTKPLLPDKLFVMVATLQVHENRKKIDIKPFFLWVYFAFKHCLFVAIFTHSKLEMALEITV